MIKKISVYAILFFINYFSNCTAMSQEELNKKLMQACTNLNSIAIKNYLTLGANPNYQDENLNTPLHKTIEAGDKNIFVLKPIVTLLQYGADLNIPNNEGLNPLMITVQKNDLNITQLLFEFGTLDTQVISDILEYCQQNADSGTIQVLKKFADEYIITTELKSTIHTELALSDNFSSYKLQAGLIILLAYFFIVISNEIQNRQVYY